MRQIDIDRREREVIARFVSGEGTDQERRRQMIKRKKKVTRDSGWIPAPTGARTTSNYHGERLY